MSTEEEGLTEEIVAEIHALVHKLNKTTGTAKLLSIRSEFTLVEEYYVGPRGLPGLPYHHLSVITSKLLMPHKE